jgi:hypothetical protein
MKLITLTQPWASLVALGVKTMITCPHATAYVGPVTIYVAKTDITIDDPYIQRLSEKLRLGCLAGLRKFVL